jgi:diacylglycerol kinase family enzyme
MKTFALINPAAGGVTGDGEAKLRHALYAAGLTTAAIETLNHEDSAAQMAEIVEMNPDLFIVWGGDGTLRSALAVVGQTCPNLLLLPGGTMNLLTKSIHGDHPWSQILANVAKSSRRVTLPAGQLNDERFYCAMLAGAPARFAEARESLRRGEIASVLTGARGALEALQTIHLKARVGEGYQCADDRDGRPAGKERPDGNRSAGRHHRHRRAQRDVDVLPVRLAHGDRREDRRVGHADHRQRGR